MPSLDHSPLGAPQLCGRPERLTAGDFLFCHELIDPLELLQDLARGAVRKR